jgi:hypothetical protein
MTALPLSLAETKAFATLLNRAEAEETVTRNLSPYLEALADIVDYGTHLIPRCWLSSGRSLKDMVLLPVLLKQIVAMVDAATELLKKGCVEPALLQLRASFEASVYLEWILRSKTEKSARVYYVWNTRRGRNWARRALKGTRERRQLLSDLGRSVTLPSVDSDEWQQRIKDDLKRYELHLTEPKNKRWNAAFDRKRGKRRYDPEWYQVLFRKRRSLSHIAKLLGRLPEYRVIYEIGSDTMHSSRSDTHVRILEKKQLGMRSLRDLSEFGFVSQMLMGVAIESYRKILTHYRPAEVTAFGKKYSQNWREALLTRVTVKYDYELVQIS